MRKAPIDTSPRSPSGIEYLSTRDCETLLATTTTVGRLAFHARDGLQLLPVNFVYRNGCVYLKTSPDSVLAELALGSDEVVFETDHADEAKHVGWSVVVTGKARQVDDAEVDLFPGAPRPWASGRRDVLIEVTPNRISGRRIGTPRPRPGL